MSLPIFLHKYFWDIDPKKAQPKAHPEYYIKRVLELGDRRAFNWLKKVYGERKIKSVLPHVKLSPKSANFWKLVLK
ncbi:MAG: hypothetical protein Q8Q24_00880 [bacterium]|nr:hypothetical protein [bacterium]